MATLEEQKKAGAAAASVHCPPGGISPWTRWASTNEAGWVDGPVYTPTPIVALVGLAQANFGLINLRLGFTDVDGSLAFTPWLSSNMGDGAYQVGPVQCPPKFFAYGMSVMEQDGYGLVDARLNYPGNNTDWLVNNRAGAQRDLTAPADMIVNGAQAREQGGFGLINIQLHVGNKA